MANIVDSRGRPFPPRAIPRGTFNNAIQPYALPNFDPNPSLTPQVKRGSAAYAGIFDEMVQTDAVIASAYQDARLTAMATQWDLRWPKWHKPTPDDEAFIVRCRKYLITSPIVIDALSVTGGEALAGYMLDYAWFGFAGFAPVFTNEDLEDSALTIEWYPWRPSSVAQWRLDVRDGVPMGAMFATSTGSREVPWNDIVVVIRNPNPGEMEGQALLRPLVQLFERRKRLSLDAGLFSRVREGVIDITYPLGVSDADLERYKEQVASMQAGETRAFFHDDKTVLEVKFPTGTGPDTVGEMNACAQEMRELLSTSMGGADFGAGSRAMAETIKESDESKNRKWVEATIGHAATAMMRWIARAVGYGGRTMPVMVAVTTEASVNPAQSASAYVQARIANVVSGKPGDEEWLRGVWGAPIPEPETVPAVSPTGTAVEDAPAPLAVGSIQAAVQVMTTPGLAPGAQKALLVIAGVPESRAEEMVSAQAAYRPPPAQPAPTQPASAPTDTTAPPATLAADADDSELAELAGDVPDYAVPDAVRAACRAALDAHMALPVQRRSTDTVAIQVARDLAAGRRIRWSRVLAMLRWMERDAVRAKRGGTDLDADTGKVAQAYRLRGGPAAVRWLRDVYRQHAEGAHMRSVRLSADDVDTTPTDGMVEEAERGLAWRKEHGRGGTAVGVARARDIAGRKSLSPDTVRRMVSYFARHEVDKKGAGWSPGEDGFPSAGRIAWALWGGDAGQTWANKVAGQLDRQAKLAAQTDGTGDVEVVGADGKPFLLYRPLRPEEAAVAWVTLAGERDDADEELADEMGRIADAQRKATWEASADGWQPGEADAVREKFERLYREAIERYTERVSATARAAAIAEAKRMLESGDVALVRGAVPAAEAEAADAAATATAARKLQAAELQTDLAAKAAAQRVQGEVGQAVIAGATEETFVPRITPDGLAKDAKAAGTQAEAAARLEAATDPDVSDLGLVPYSVIRTSIPDRSRCRHCREMDTGKEIVLSDVEVRPGVYAIPELPDPECEGAPNCRCGYLVTYRAGSASVPGGGERKAA